MGNKLVIIEDNPSDARILQHYMAGLGYDETRSSISGLEGLSACLVDPPEVVLLDLQLPMLRGEEVCRLLRASEACRGIIIIIVSELPDAQRREMELLGIGADAYLKKPFSKPALQSALELAQGRRTGASGAAPSESVATSNMAVCDEPTTAPVPDGRTQPPGGLGVFQGYRLIEMVGAGGMGTVYRALQLSLDRPVALKVLQDFHSDANQMAARFDREARIMALINHPNIVQVFDFGRSDYHCFISMEYADGGSVLARARARQLTWRLVRTIVSETCEALAYLHARKIIHRDIKPSNILLTQDDKVKLADFGITSAELPPLANGIVLDDRIVLGTPSFLAPEIAQTRVPTALTDQYALGVTIWQLLSGKLPREALAPLHEIRPAIPRKLSDVLARSMAANPADRFGTIQDMADAFLSAVPKD